MLVQSTATPILTAIKKGKIVGAHGGENRPDRLEISVVQRFVLSSVAVRGQEKKMWFCPAELVRYEEVGVADFSNLKTCGTDIAAITSLIVG
jgi:hypothetical protein